MNKHTPEPWVAVGKGVYTPIPMSHQIVSAFHQSADDVAAEANAQRIVACVNACEGKDPKAVPTVFGAAYRLAMFVLQSDLYQTDEEAAVEVDKILAAVAKTKEV